LGVDRVALGVGWLHETSAKGGIFWVVNSPYLRLKVVFKKEKERRKRGGQKGLLLLDAMVSSTRAESVTMIAEAALPQENCPSIAAGLEAQIRN